MKETNRQVLDDIRERQYVIAAATLEIVADSRRLRHENRFLRQRAHELVKNCEEAMHHNGILMRERRVLRQKLIEMGVKI